MNRTQGIALITSIIILALVAAAGLGAVFLGVASLRLAESQRTHMIAKSNAEVAMEIAYIQLNQAYQATGSFPADDTTFTLATSPSAAITYQANAVQYQVLGAGDEARIVLLGTGPRDARYQTEAVFALESASTPDFPVGFVSESVVTIDGNVGYDDIDLTNAQIHGNLGFSLDGDGAYQSCSGSGADEVCVTLSGDDIPVTAATGQGSYTCYSSDNPEFCNSGTPTDAHLTDPVIIGTPPYEAIRDAALGADPGTVYTSPPCDVSATSLASTYAAGTTVCLTNNYTLSSSRTYTDVNIIVYGNLTIDNDLTLNGANVLATGNFINYANIDLNTSRIFSNTYLHNYGNIFSTGSSTIASGGDIVVEGNIEHNDPGEDVGLLIASVGDFYAPGNMEKGSDGTMLHGYVWSGGTATVNGNVKLRGGIGAVGDLTISGNATADGRAVAINIDLPNDATVAYVSRR